MCTKNTKKILKSKCHCRLSSVFGVLHFLEKHGWFIIDYYHPLTELLSVSTPKILNSQNEVISS